MLDFTRQLTCASRTLLPTDVVYIMIMKKARRKAMRRKRTSKINTLTRVR